MPPFIHDDFLLSNDTARALYHEHAAHQPIYDYHCHLPPADLSNNRTFANLFEAWLEGDHYKWRAMRANGIDERYCTGASGGADPYEKFLAFARTVPHTLRNPLYHWTHLELKRYFGIDELLSEKTAPGIWEEANRQLANLPVSTIMQKFNVALIGTTDAPADDLAHHRRIEKDNTFPDTAVHPAFRPDKAHDLSNLETWNQTIDALGRAAGVKIERLDDLLDALAKRHAFFHERGARLSDHGLTYLPAMECSDKAARAIFARARGLDDRSSTRDIETPVTPLDGERFTSYLMLFFGKLDHAAGWTHQLHLGAMRNNNGWAMKNLGPDTGFDSIGDYKQGPGLRRHLGILAARETLPKVVLYNLNPADNYLFASMAGNFQSTSGSAPASTPHAAAEASPRAESAGTPGIVPGKTSGVQYGSGWWFLDQKEAMTWQLNALSNLGLLSRFVGMLTDSRSFLSYPRHEYFRRLLCDLLGRDVEAGELPRDMDLLGPLVENICFGNAKRYFGMQLRGRFA